MKMTDLFSAQLEREAVERPPVPGTNQDLLAALDDSAAPSIYGPTADDRSFG